ncbi:MAG: AgmX/PglI C-terminal domain-containing protein [Deltaproteobacteria bacterium]|nr:AgmX/PglI C-terminal domain-containing protein [Deltaproteobacteria bacterium]MBN2671573.1 AgmX/PglI C-terminal domain-containing protein [Deltaproteobacteria bacterium]
MSRISWRGALHASPKSESATRKQIVEVAVYWNGTCLQLDQIELGRDESNAYNIGESPDCRFMVAREYLNASEYRLLHAQRDEVTIQLPAGASGEVRNKEQSQPFSALSRTQSMSLEEGAYLAMHLGPWMFTFARSEAEPIQLSRFGFGFVPSRWTYLSVALHAVFFMLVAMMPPEVSGMNIDDQMQNSRIFKYMILASEQPPVEQKVETPTEAPKEGNAGKAQTGTAGKAGDRNAKPSDGRMAVTGPRDTKDPKIGKELLKQTMNTQGVLTFLKPTITSPFGEGVTIGRDPENVLGNLIGDHIGTSSGYEGFAINGAGRGGGGNGDGTLGVGNNLMSGWGHDANGNCVGSLCGSSGWKAAHELKDKSRRPRVPILKPGVSTVAGSLSKEIIRRHIHRKLAQIRYCYEKELQSNPGLEGRVSVMFMISTTGAVRTSSVAQSTIGNTNVESCIANVVKHITFPVPPDGGNVIVTYPFTLVQSGN